MKLLFFCEYYYPDRFLITDIAEELVKQGHEVTVVTGLPNYSFPNGKVPKEYKKKMHRQETINGVKVLRCFVVGRGKNKIRLLLNYFSYMYNAKKMSEKLDDNYDVVFVYQLTPILQMYPAIKYCERTNKKLVCYCLDLAPESGISIMNRVPFLKKWYADFSKWAYKKCSKIAVTSESFISYLNEVNEVDLDNLLHIPQHAPKDLLMLDLSKEAAEKNKTLLFAGNMGNGARLETIIKAAGILKEKGYKQFRIKFVGDGATKKRLVELVDALMLNDYVVFHDPVPMAQMPQIYKTADALLITLRKGQITVPGKLQAYMATGKPIFGAMDGSGKQVINEAKCGICVEAESSEMLAKVLSDYLDSPELYTEMGENGKRFFEDNFTLEKYINKLTSFFESVIKKNN